MVLPSGPHPEIAPECLIVINHISQSEIFHPIKALIRLFLVYDSATPGTGQEGEEQWEAHWSLSFTSPVQFSRAASEALGFLLFVTSFGGRGWKELESLWIVKEVK